MDLRKSYESVLVACGQMFSHLTHSGSRAIPNPPRVLPLTIDQAMAAYQAILDQVDIEIQLSRSVVERRIREEQNKAHMDVDVKSEQQRDASVEVVEIDDDDEGQDSDRKEPSTKDRNQTQTMNASAFDDDISAMMNGTDDMGGLFGDEFDFIIS